MVLGRFNIAVVVTSRAGAGRISSAFTSPGRECGASVARTSHAGRTRAVPWGLVGGMHAQPDRKSTRLNSSHSQISYAVFCLKKKICQVHSVQYVECTISFYLSLVRPLSGQMPPTCFCNTHVPWESTFIGVPLFIHSNSLPT